VAQAVGSPLAYVDPWNTVVFLPATAATAAALEGLKPAATESFGANCTDVSPGGTITPALGACFRLLFTGTDSTFTVGTAGIANLAIFSAHVPTEFERNSHYFLSADRTTDIETVAEFPIGHAHG